MATKLPSKAARVVAPKPLPQPAPGPKPKRIGRGETFSLQEKNVVRR